ncbi:MAG: TIGR03905 family TSCPD domain-containing protein [Clostridia bacterium]|nr:TIGR03905 family TSCPD domain-containing protein [Clostridia bacterium]
MKKTISYNTRGTCSRRIDIECEGGVITDCKFIGGCSGNTQGIASLVIGMKIEDAIAKTKGIKCGFKNTSCPDQLSIALERLSEND